MKARKWLPVVLPFAVGLLGTDVHWSLVRSDGGWGSLAADLFYIPVVIAAISLGARAALTVALAAGVFHVGAAVLFRADSLLQPIAETALFVCVALTTAKLAEWTRSVARRDALAAGAPPELMQRSYRDVDDADQMSALSRMVAGLVKQFRNPVTSIEGAGWVLEDSRLPDEKRQEFVGIIRKESHRLNRVLSDVSDFTRPRKPRYQTVDLSALIDEVIELAGPRDHGPYFLFRKEVPPDFPPLRCDPEQIRQALLNVAMNAIQASPGGGPIEIAAAAEENEIKIRVKDHGRGVPGSMVDKIFDPFFTTHENSLGLGLSVARHLVTGHGGTIAVEFTSEQGTCIVITVPGPGNRP